MKNFLLRWFPVIFYCSLIFYLSSRPGVGTSHDKLVHLLVYGIMGFLFARAFRIHLYKMRWVLVFAFLSATFYGISDELHQYYVPGRRFEVWDIVADSIGAFLGAFLYVLPHRLPKFKTSN